MQIKRLHLHTCNRLFKVPLVSRKWLVEKYACRIRSNPKYPIKSLRQDIRTEHVIDVSRSMLYRVRTDVATEIMDDEKEQYKLLWSYCAEIMRANLDSNYRIKAKPYAENQAVFHKVYICPGPLKRGFLIGCRPFIGLDGSFLKENPRVLLTAVRVDTNGQVYQFHMQ